MKALIGGLAYGVMAMAGASVATARTTPASASAAPAMTADAPWPEACFEPWPEAHFEIFKCAPGAQEDVIRRIARADEVSKAGGPPPVQISVHLDGADWDVLPGRQSRRREGSERA